MRGIILATRLRSHAFTIDARRGRPLISYPLSTLMAAGIREILIIAAPPDVAVCRRLLGDGRELGVQLRYAARAYSNQTVDDLVAAERFIQGEPVALIRGSDIFAGPDLGPMLATIQGRHGAHVFARQVQDPGQHAVVVLNHATGDIRSIEERPERRTRSSFAVPGLYFYDGDVIDRARSRLGTHSLTDLNRTYLEDDALRLTALPRDVAWLDVSTVTPRQAAGFVRATERRLGHEIGCAEAIAARQGWTERRPLVVVGA